MLQFKRPSLGVAVGAAVPELLQHIRSDFPPAQLASLVFDSGNLWVLQGGCVELDALHLDAAHRGLVEPPPRPDEHIANARTQAGWEPLLCSPAMLEPSGAVPQIGGSAPTTVACSPLERLTDLLASMGEVSEHQGVMDLACFFRFDAHGMSG